MQWLNDIVEQIMARHPDGEIIVESGISPSGGYHMGYLREILTCDAIKLAIEARGRTCRHIHFVDDLDGFRKVPAGLPSEYEKYLGKPLCDMPAPDGSDQSYADYSLRDFLASLDKLGVEIDIVRSHEKYRAGFFVPAIEKTLENVATTRKVLEEISGRKLEDHWAPIQVNEDGYLKNRRFVSIDKDAKTITYLDADGQEQVTSYAAGEVKLNWRLDWPARWWLVGVDVEPFGRDHGTKGGSYDTGAALMKEVFDAPAPLPVPYNFINRAGETKKISASTGGGILMSEAVAVLPPEVARFFVLRYSPDKLLFFDPVDGVVRLIDEYAELLAKPDKSPADQQLIAIASHGIEPTVSNVPFSHLVASYQAALRDPSKTIDIIKRTEHAGIAAKQQELITKELKFIDEWLERWAPPDVRFDLTESPDASKFSEAQINFFAALASEIERAPADADGDWFHSAIYNLKDSSGLEPNQLFSSLYQLIIGQDSGPRAGWFLNILPRDWLLKRLRLEA